MAADSQLRITTWPADQVPDPAVQRFPQARLQGEVLHLGGQVAPATVPDQVRLFELADLDADDPAALVELTQSLGCLAPYDLGSDLAHDGASDVARHAHQHGRTFDPSKSRADGGLMLGASRSDGRRVHLDELAYRLHLLRSLSDHVAAHALGRSVRKVDWPPGAPRRLRTDVGDWRHFSLHINAALRPFQVRVHVALGAEDVTPAAVPGLFSVAALQLVNDLTAHLDYHVCAAEHCGRLFVRQRGRSFHYSRSKGSIYCSKSCMNAQTQREYRRRQRAVKKAGRA